MIYKNFSKEYVPKHNEVANKIQVYEYKCHSTFLEWLHQW